MFGRQVELDILCELIEQKPADFILDYKNKIDNVFGNRKIMCRGRDRNWSVSWLTSLGSWRAQS